MTVFVRLLAVIAVGLLPSLAACQPPAPPPAQATAQRTKQQSATVESSDMGTRLVVLRAEDGTKESFVASPEVRNLPQVRVGDKVTATYQEAIAVRMAPVGSAAPNTAVITADRAALGRLPPAVAGSSAGNCRLATPCHRDPAPAGRPTGPCWPGSTHPPSPHPASTHVPPSPVPRT